jgi:hypothetical protein
MSTVRRTFISTGLVVMAIVASAAFVSAAPAGSSQGKSGVVAAPVSVAPAAAHSSTGHIFGKEISGLARAIPAGRQHGALISSFARDNNPHNFKHLTKPSHPSRSKKH